MSLNYTETELTLTLNCTSFGLPPTTVTWIKDGVKMSSVDKYIFSQRVVSVDNIVYENVLIINGKSGCDVQGSYVCSVQCSDDIGEMVKSAADSVSVTGKFT